MPGPTPKALRLLFGEAKDLLAAQLDALAKMDSKAEAVARFNLLIVGFAVTILTLLRSGGGAAVVPVGTGLLLASGFAAIVVSTVTAVHAYLKKDVSIGLRSQGLVEALAYDTEETALLEEAIREYAEGIDANSRLVSNTSRRLKAAMGSLIVGVVALAGGAAWLLFLGGY